MGRKRKPEPILTLAGPDERRDHMAWIPKNLAAPRRCRRKWKKRPPIGHVPNGCLNCPSKPPTLSLRRLLAVGFGMVRLTRCGQEIWSGDDEHATIQRAENLARKDPRHDWRLEFQAPMWSGVWQRQGKNRWVAIRKGVGFA